MTTAIRNEVELGKVEGEVELRVGKVEENETGVGEARAGPNESNEPAGAVKSAEPKAHRPARSAKPPTLPKSSKSSRSAKVRRPLPRLDAEGRWRPADGRSLGELARQTGLDRSYLSRLAGGKRKPSLRAALRLANALNLPVEAVLAEMGYNLASWAEAQAAESAESNTGEAA